MNDSNSWGVGQKLLLCAVAVQLSGCGVFTQLTLMPAGAAIAATRTERCSETATAGQPDRCYKEDTFLTFPTAMLFAPLVVGGFALDAITSPLQAELGTLCGDNACGPNAPANW